MKEKVTKKPEFSTMVECFIWGISLVGGTYWHNGYLLGFAYWYAVYKLVIGFMMLILYLIIGVFTAKEHA